MATIVHHRHIPPASAHVGMHGVRGKLIGTLQRAIDFVARAGTIRSNRKSLGRLTHYDDHMLADMGLSRGDLHEAMSLPFMQDPSLYLASQRSQNLSRALRGVRRR